jgi:hypothetical protein
LVVLAPIHIEGTRVLLANEPRTYREVLFEALPWRRPGLEVEIAEPGTLDAEVERLHPHLVVCSRDRGTARNDCLTWVRLYPNGENLAEIFTAGGRATIVGFGFGDLLSVVDGTGFLRRSAEGGGRERCGPV